MVVLDVGLEVLRQVVDALRKDRHLHFRRASVAGLGRIGLDNVRLTVGCDRHRISYLSIEERTAAGPGCRPARSPISGSRPQGPARPRCNIVENLPQASGIYAAPPVTVNVSLGTLPLHLPAVTLGQ